MGSFSMALSLKMGFSFVLVHLSLFGTILTKSLHTMELLHKSNGRIVGGMDATIERFPYQASLWLYGHHVCGAVIIRSSVLISAGHCVNGREVPYMTVIAGTSDLNGTFVERQVANYITHEDYDPWTLESDIALVFLELGLDFTAKIQPVKLASVGEELKYGTKAFVSGWGILEEGGRELSPKLQYTVVTIWNQGDCKAAYDDLNEVTATMICAGEMEGGKDACSGDSGGPLTIGDKLFGSVSWGLGCARPGKPSVYAKISVFRPWIESKLKQFFI